MPDWVFDTNEMKIKYNERKYLRQPKLEFSIFETTEKRYYWELFSKYHYLNHSHNNASRVFVAFLNDDLCGFCSVLHFPHPKNDKIKRGHRLVILPDYQGLGLGNILSNKIAEYFVKNGFDYYSLTSSPSLIHNRLKSKNWILMRQSRMPHDKTNMMKKTDSSNRITTSFKYKL